MPQERDALRKELEAALDASRVAQARAEVAEVEADARVQAMASSLEEERLARQRAVDECRRMSQQVAASISREQVLLLAVK